MEINIRHIIWDWNGTLLDDAAECVTILNTLLARRHLPLVSVEEYQRDFGFPVINFYRKIGFTFENESYEKVSEEYITEYLTITDRLPLRHDARETLHAFHTAGINQHVLSALRHDLLEDHIASRGIRPHFTSVRGLNDLLAAGKVENGRRLMWEQSIRPEETLFVGDTIHDYEVACEMGINSCILIHGGHQEPRRLQQTGALIMHNLHEVAQWLLTGKPAENMN